MNCTGVSGSAKRECENRNECKFFMGNYHEEIVKKMKQKHSEVAPFNCMMNDYSMFEEIEYE